MKAEIVSVGSELLLGQIVDTNSSFLASQLPMLGIDLYWVSQVGDNKQRLVEVLERAWNRSDVTFTVGGLGPTEDDLTREAIAAMLGEKMEVDQKLLQELKDFFARRGLDMPQRNVKQVTLIPSAKSIPNPRGTAPGWWVERDGRLIIAMPGPPIELQRMWNKEVSIALRERMKDEIILSKSLKTFGVPEATVDEMLSSLLCSTNPTFGIYSKPHGIEVCLTAKAQRREAAEALIAEMEAKVRTIMGDSLWGTDDDTLEGKIGAMLLERNMTLATMESCTGGLLASAITDAPGSSAYFKGGIVSYANELKVASGVDSQLIEAYGAVSPQVAEAMAAAVRDRLQADVGIGITGVAGPDEVEGKSVGLVYIAIDAGGRKIAYQGNYPPNRPDVKRRAAIAALFKLRELLLSY